MFTVKKKTITQHHNFLYATYRKRRNQTTWLFFLLTIYRNNKLHVFTAKEKFFNFVKNEKCMQVATRPIYGPIVILSPALKHWGPPRRYGLCSHGAHLWSTSVFVPCCEVSPPPPSRDGGGYVATRPTCGPLLIFSPARKRVIEPPTNDLEGVIELPCPPHPPPPNTQVEGALSGIKVSVPATPPPPPACRRQV